MQVSGVILMEIIMKRGIEINVEATVDYKELIKKKAAYEKDKAELIALLATPFTPH